MYLIAFLYSANRITSNPSVPNGRRIGTKTKRQRSGHGAGGEESRVTEPEFMHDQAVRSYLDVEIEYLEAKSFLDDLEPSSGGRAALVSKVADLELERAQRYLRARATQLDKTELDEPAPFSAQLAEKPAPWNGRGVLWSVLACCVFWYCAYELTATIFRRLA